MELEEAKMEIVQFLAKRVDGKIQQRDLRALISFETGTELYFAAIKSLQSERIIIEEDKYIQGEAKSYFVLTESGKEKFNIRVREYVPERRTDRSDGRLRVVGTGGQTLGYTSAPSRTECVAYLLGAVIVLAIVLFVVLQ